MTIEIGKYDPPLPYRCANYERCGMSSSHDPEYVGWRRVDMWTRVCSKECAAQVLMRRAADALD